MSTANAPLFSLSLPIYKPMCSMNKLFNQDQNRKKEEKEESEKEIMFIYDHRILRLCFASNICVTLFRLFYRLNQASVTSNSLINDR